MIDVKTQYSTYNNCVVQLDNYMADGSLAIELWNKEEGPIARLTVCLSNPEIEKNQAYVDTNNCPWAEKLIKDYNLGKPTEDVGFSGYCAYPLYEFNLEELKKHEK